MSSGTYEAELCAFLVVESTHCVLGYTEVIPGRWPVAHVWQRQSVKYAGGWLVVPADILVALQMHCAAIGF